MISLTPIHMGSKKKKKGIKQTQIQRTNCSLPRRIGVEGGMDEKDERLQSTNCQLYKWSQGCKVQHR